VCGEHPKMWSWDAKALACGARRSDRVALQVTLPLASLVANLARFVRHSHSSSSI
jgi:hypothetical protein